MGNGCIEDISQHAWIHKNNETFTASLSDLLRAPYTFVFLRCPYSRLVSAYFDKIVGHTPVAWQLIDLLDRKIEIADLTFEEFVRLMLRPMIRGGNIHWRPQTEFLVYREYDDYFNVANLLAAEKKIRETIGLNLIDARPFTRHGTNEVEFTNDFENPHTISPVILFSAKASGRLPPPKNLYTKELIDVVKNAFTSDIELVTQQFGTNALMFS